jgi:hypothetical protein
MDIISFESFISQEILRIENELIELEDVLKRKLIENNTTIYEMLDFMGKEITDASNTIIQLMIFYQLKTQYRESLLDLLSITSQKHSPYFKHPDYHNYLNDIPMLLPQKTNDQLFLLLVEKEDICSRFMNHKPIDLNDIKLFI